MRQLLFLFLLTSPSLFGQAYFQQEVNYVINVSLDDEKHVLHGFEEIEYINNSPDALDRIYMHLWPNAYKNGETALAKQLYLEDDDALVYGNDAKGWIDSLDFRINGDPCKWHFDENHIDIAVLWLKTPLQPGERLQITTPFSVQIPSATISRLGHIKQSYQITQWYPKPAVYDKEGWQQMPYLGQGEFYSEYGSFDVSITLPENYVVGATGDLQTPGELQFLDSLAAANDAYLKANKIRPEKIVRGGGEFPKSSTNYKTIRYTQRNVHDFAWFADKRYKVLKGRVLLPHSGREVTTWAMYTPRAESYWQHAIEYINDATYFYSLWNGDYPYNQVTAVDGTISAGSGMEYPNITVIGNEESLQQFEIVVVHEVGHNWFYGQLGSNERDHGWMDEGLNTLNEVRYMQTKYPGNKAFTRQLFIRMHFNHLSHHDGGDIAYRSMSWFGEDQPIATHSEEFSSGNYGLVMYSKTGLVFFYLKDYLGEELFDRCMRAYYSEWEFKHPTPQDLRRSLEKTSGLDLSWLFDELIATTAHVDFKLKRVKRHHDETIVTIKNVGQVDGPMPVSVITHNADTLTQWSEPGEKKVTFTFNQPSDEIIIDPDRNIPEIYRHNNRFKKEGLFGKVERPKLQFLFGDNESDRSNIYWTPVLAGNFYDRLMIGAVFHNHSATPPKYSYLISPLFSVKRLMVSGIAEFAVTTQPKKVFKQSRLGLAVKSFKHDTTYLRNESYYLAFNPYWLVKLGNRDKRYSRWSHDLRFEGMYRKDQFGLTHFEHAGGFVEYKTYFKHPDHKLTTATRLMYLSNVNNDQEIARITAEANYQIRYSRKEQERWIQLRGFIGQQFLRFFSNSTQLPGRFGEYQYAMSLSGNDGQQDLFLEEYFMGRNNIRGLWSQQRLENMGGFRSTSYYGTTNFGMVSVNLWAELPYVPRVFGAFVDYGVFDNGVSFQSAINTGLGFRLGDYVGIYFPIWMSQELRSSFGNSNYLRKIRFTLKLNLANRRLRVNELI